MKEMWGGWIKYSWDRVSSSQHIWRMMLELTLTRLKCFWHLQQSSDNITSQFIFNTIYESGVLFLPSLNISFIFNIQKLKSCYYETCHTLSLSNRIPTQVLNRLKNQLWSYERHKDVSVIKESFWMYVNKTVLLYILKHGNITVLKPLHMLNCIIMLWY